MQLSNNNTAIIVNMRQQIKQLYTVLLLILVATSCHSSKPDYRSLSANMQSFWLDTGLYQHWIVKKTEGLVTDTLHIYIEGDGKPWLNNSQIASDPTPGYPLALDLLANSPYPGIYIGRPCYFQPPNAKQCNPGLWTNARYSAEVVNSMRLAILQILAASDYEQITLIGYSGGGVIATLLANKLPQTDRLITLAANLDIAAWSEYHHYSPLNLSLNPAEQISLGHYQQYHLQGQRDKVVPPATTAVFFANQPKLTPLVLPDNDHICCWVKQWSDWITRLQNYSK